LTDLFRTCAITVTTLKEERRRHGNALIQTNFTTLWGYVRTVTSSFIFKSSKLNENIFDYLI